MNKTTRGMPNPIKYSVVVPVYGNAESIVDLCSRLSEINQALKNQLEAVFVVDGSPDDSLEILQKTLPLQNFRSRLLVHSKNFGAFPAIRTGFSNARGDFIAAMAADLQEPPELILEFFSLLESDDCDIAIGTRESRNDPESSQFFSAIYWKMYKTFILPAMPSGGVDIFAANRMVAGHLLNLNESNSSLVGLLMWVGFRRLEVPYSRLERKHGKSAWSFKKKINYLMDSVFSFTSLPVTIILILGSVGTALTFFIGIAVFVTWLVGGIKVPGYAAQMLVQLLSSGSLLLAVGIVGTYTWRTYENSKMRPPAIVMTDETY